MGSHVLSLVDQPTHFTWYWVTPFDSRPATTLDRLRLVRVLASSRVEGSGRRALGPRRALRLGRCRHRLRFLCGGGGLGCAARLGPPLSHCLMVRGASVMTARPRFSLAGNKKA